MNRKNVERRFLDQHCSTMVELLENLKSMFPDDETLTDYILYMKNAVVGDEAAMKKGVEKWCTTMREPLKKGSAKYLKAVESLTGETATVYHAFSYRDSVAVYASTSSQTLLELGLDEKLLSGAFDASSKAVFWEYIDELNRTAYAGVGKNSDLAKVPVVPSREEIHADITKRKNASSSSLGNKESLSQGVHESLSKIFKKRANGAAPPEPNELCKRVSNTSEGVLGDKTVRELCQARDESGFAAFVHGLDKDATWHCESIDSEEWETVNQCIGLSTMHSSIPPQMMRGIENVANKLAKDMMEGKTSLSDLNVDAIGQQVLSGLGSEDISDFANNMDKILPALGGMRGV